MRAVGVEGLASGNLELVLELRELFLYVLLPIVFIPYLDMVSCACESEYPTNYIFPEFVGKLYLPPLSSSILVAKANIIL